MFLANKGELRRVVVAFPRYPHTLHPLPSPEVARAMIDMENKKPHKIGSQVVKLRPVSASTINS